MIVEQAIFTSARTNLSTGYHLVATSSGLCETDVRELSLTGPSHDSLWEQSPEAMSVNFHALPSGAWCVSQTTPEGEEYSGRGGPRIYTHSLIVHAEDLRANFANNPLALLRTALGQGALQVFDVPPKSLESFELHAQTAAVDQGLLAAWSAEADRIRLAAILDAVIAAPRLGLAAGTDSLRMVASILGMLPVDCRTQVTFSTGLRYSPARPFRVCCVESNQAVVRRLQRSYGLPIVESETTPHFVASPSESWGAFVAQSLARGEWARFSEALQVRRPGVSLDRLPELARCLCSGQVEPAWQGNRQSSDRRASEPAADAHRHHVTLHREDGEHRSMPAGLLAAAVLPRVAAVMDEPSTILARRFPNAAEQLLRLEGIVFESLAGRPAAAAGMVELWRELLHDVGRKHATEVRELYMRYAITLWRELNDSDPQSSHERGLGALEVLGVLAEGAA